MTDNAKELLALDPVGLNAAVRECARITAPEIDDAEFERIKAENSPRYRNTVKDMERVIHVYLSARQQAAGWDDNKLAAWARNWHWNDCAEDKPVDPSIYFRDRRMLKAFVESLRREAPAPAEGSYRNAIDEALVVRHLGVAKGDAKTELDQIINWEVEVALDPAVSERARQLAARPDTAEARLRKALEDIYQTMPKGREREVVKQALSGGDEAKESEGGVESRHAKAFAQPGRVEPEVAPGPSEPSPPADRREIVARIIDPEGFDSFAVERAWAQKWNKSDSWWEPWQWRCDRALRKADAIIAALDKS